jgi:tubulin beta
MQASQCCNQIQIITNFWQVVCDERGIGGDGKYCGDGKYALLFDLEPGVIGAVRASPLCELFRPGNLVCNNAGTGKICAKGHSTRTGHEFC